jgi:predicted Zn-dependent protease with MMP-like domain
MARMHEKARFLVPPTSADLVALATEALETIPEKWRRHVDNVVIKVEDFADPGTLHGLEIKSPLNLLGLYEGVPMIGKSLSHVLHDMDRIFLYRCPIVAYCYRTGDDLFDVVRHVLIHEIGHHFGLSDEDIERIEAEA